MSKKKKGKAFEYTDIPCLLMEASVIVYLLTVFTLYVHLFSFVSLFSLKKSRTILHKPYVFLYLFYELLHLQLLALLPGLCIGFLTFTTKSVEGLSCA